ncbi:hypothetical protein ABPG74_002648 [Tetrahymena malaccensis]
MDNLQTQFGLIHYSKQQESQSFQKRTVLSDQSIVSNNNMENSTNNQIQYENLKKKQAFIQNNSDNTIKKSFQVKISKHKKTTKFFNAKFMYTKCEQKSNSSFF